MLERDGGEAAARLDAYLTLFAPFLHDRLVIRRTHQHNHILKILGRRPDKGDATNVNLFLCLAQCCFRLCYRLSEGIEVYDDEVNLRDAILLQLINMRWQIAPCQDTT